MSEPGAQGLQLLQFPFAGVQVIEASAGTGKTWTLAALYLRLLLEPRADGRYLLPPDILVMTFTDPATQELRDRIRARIVEAEAAFRQAEAWMADDPFLAALRDGFPASQWSALARRLQLAGQWMDEAAIFTIHAWSSRMLRQHAFDSGSLFRQQRVENSDELQREVVRDYWRRHVYALDAVPAEALRRYPSSPEALWRKLQPLLRWIQREPREPGRSPWPQPPVDPAQQLREWVTAFERFSVQQEVARALWRRHQEALEVQLREAMRKHLSGVNFKKHRHEIYLQMMRDWVAGDSLSKDDLKRFGIDNLKAAKLKAGQPVEDQHGVYRALQNALECWPGDPPGDDLLPHAAQWVHAACAERKQHSAQFDFHDLLQRLHDALQPADGQLALAIRRQYPVALVDEFQDTDPWQYGALRRIYVDPPPAGVQAPPAALVLIGDPKQAIYSFRGADLPTYLAARRAAAGLYTLDENHRSTPSLVEAVNHVFASAGQPFGEIGFHRVQGRRTDIRPLQCAGRDLPALTVWHLAGEPMTAPALRQQLAEGFATQVVQLLAQGSATPADIAVLVRNRREAALVRDALGRRQLRSVYLSERDSVYATAEAQDLWALMDAITRPRSVNALKAALSTPLLARTPAELDALFADELRFNAEAERFAQWQQLWQRQGFLALLHAVLHELQLPARLLEASTAHQGERRLTNLLHLGELLQAASQSLQGERALVRHLAQQMRDPESGNDVVQMRLETDAELVKVITLHKSKGLQYPVVLIPFANDFRQAKRDAGLPDDGIDPDAARVAEDLRLLYVGFTRAQRALYLGAATRKQDFHKADPPRSALSRLLGRQSADDLLQRLAQWTACEHIVAAPLPEPTSDAWRPAVVPTVARAARVPRRQHRNRWRSTSFSALVRDLDKHLAAPLPSDEQDDRTDDAKLDNPPPAEGLDAFEPAPAPAAVTRWQDFPAGARYGDLLHKLLEWQVEARWPLLDDARQSQEWQTLLSGYASILDLNAERQHLLTAWLQAVACCPLQAGDLPLPALKDLPPASTWVEMGFTLPLGQAATRHIDQLMHRHVLPGQPRPALNEASLQGQLTGFIDLLFEHDGRYYVLDYKSNRLPAGYALPQLQAAMLEHRYDLQYTLYLVALHRLLTVRLRGYDYDRHVGGALYLFARGVGTPGQGLYHDRPPRQLIEGLSALFQTAEAA